MLRRPQRTEAAQRLEARTARTFAAPLRAGVSSNSGPARSRRQPLRLKREHGAYRCLCSRRTVRELAAAQGVRRSNARGVRAVPVSQCRNCQHWQSVCEHRPPLQCELSRCQRLGPALEPRRE